MTRVESPLLTRATTRLLAGALAALAVFIIAPSIAGYSNRVIFAYDAAALVYLSLSWAMIFTNTAESTRLRAAAEDPGRRFGFLIALASSAAVVFGSVTWLGSRGFSGQHTGDALLVATIVAAVLAWSFTHTAYALHYAHLYYGPSGNLPPDCTSGLLFPGCPDPDDLDFAYFAFTIGMTFQVSDVQISSRSIRRTVLWHALLAFAYNTVIVALMLNLIFAALHP